jgi:hypothetical protein
VIKVGTATGKKSEKEATKTHTCTVTTTAEPRDANSLSRKRRRFWLGKFSSVIIIDFDDTSDWTAIQSKR